MDCIKSCKSLRKSLVQFQKGPVFIIDLGLALKCQDCTPVEHPARLQPHQSTSTPFHHPFSQRPKMASVSSAQSGRECLLMSRAAVELCADLKEFDADYDVIDTDDEVKTESPVYDQCYESGGSGSIIQMTNVSPTEIYGACSGL